ncbi:hypothetical protein [Candidatus Coxiella mudrowiae]|uniref:hypothetical protein n=1 Tax=Candidatus Coxiella mudrowiae TaxID=2054173 RepID=UPI0012FEE683|nr:hypothetical protein [Candidatus Coxiella mudrowiae]
MAEGTKYDMVMLTTSVPISSDDRSFLYGLVLGYEIQPPIVMNSLVDNGYISPTFGNGTINAGTRISVLCAGYGKAVFIPAVNYVPLIIIGIDIENSLLILGELFPTLRFFIALKIPFSYPTYYK